MKKYPSLYFFFFFLKCTDLLMDPTHYIIGVARTQMTKINHGVDARVNYSSALPPKQHYQLWEAVKSIVGVKK